MANAVRGVRVLGVRDVIKIDKRIVLHDRAEKARPKRGATRSVD
jgi:hypothetical protein